MLARAAQAEKDSNFEEAERLYQQHLEVAPDDQEAQLKYSGLLLKGAKNVSRMNQAPQIYELKSWPDLPDVTFDIRRRLAELSVELATLKA